MGTLVQLGCTLFFVYTLSTNENDLMVTGALILPADTKSFPIVVIYTKTRINPLPSSSL